MTFGTYPLIPQYVGTTAYGGYDYSGTHWSTTHPQQQQWFYTYIGLARWSRSGN